MMVDWAEQLGCPLMLGDCGIGVAMTGMKSSHSYGLEVRTIEPWQKVGQRIATRTQVNGCSPATAACGPRAAEYESRTRVPCIIIARQIGQNRGPYHTSSSRSLIRQIIRATVVVIDRYRATTVNVRGLEI